MKRIFIALKVEPEGNLLRMISSLRSVLGNEKINWVDLSNIHLTLAFLGDTGEERIKMADIAVRQKCSGFGVFSFNLSGTGVFKNFRDPRVIWTGIGECEKLIKLNDLIMTGLKDTGFKFEDRPFRPHITLGRIKFIKDPSLLESALEKYRDAHFQTVPVKEVILYESILKPAGPVYKPLGRFRLS
ncbi:MAG: 2'-5' RNA ligase [Bacteroidetes bacterium RBG_13_43_22]|nr:MAG: 2'-5' RNA ligase [Bacteroidetes bacterium RBG_13_43_22]